MENKQVKPEAKSKILHKNRTVFVKASFHLKTTLERTLEPVLVNLPL